MPQCDLSVAVLGVQGSTVRLGISAPPELAVHREELWQAIRAEAAGSPEPQTDPARWDALSADLSDAVDQLSVRHGSANSSADLEIAVWRALAAAVENWALRTSPPPPLPALDSGPAHAAPLPR